MLQLHLKACAKCGGDLALDQGDWLCLNCGTYYYTGLYRWVQRGKTEAKRDSFAGSPSPESGESKGWRPIVVGVPDQCPALGQAWIDQHVTVGSAEFLHPGSSQDRAMGFGVIERAVSW